MNPAAKPVRAQILVVEASSIFRDMQGLALRQAGYGVGVFDNPHLALDAAVRQHFDFALIDYELPNVKAEHFMHALRALQPGIAIGFVSDSLTPELVSKLSRHRVAAIFGKPANAKQLLEKIAEALAAPPAVGAALGEAAALASDSHGFRSMAVWAASRAPFPAGVGPQTVDRDDPAPARRTPPPRGTNPPMLATTSIFRPASKNYNFGKRLAESIALADAAGDI
jgi:CheY-like chemotaxis protein